MSNFFRTFSRLGLPSIGLAQSALIGATPNDKKSSGRSAFGVRLLLLAHFSAWQNISFVLDGSFLMALMYFQWR
jgi:hypothetical protein